MPTCAEIFEAMPSRFNADAAGDWQTTLQFLVAGDEGGEWTVEVKDGACTVTAGRIDDAKATVTTDADTWVGINAGSLNPVQAFMTGKVKVTGNMGELMKLNNPSVFRRD